jgi:fatty acid amide hydrolase 2
MVSRRNQIATEEATAVSRLRAAGAIVMGTTNVSELCMWMETTNKVYGRTRNPYNAGHIAGGSSGGEGAIVAAGGSPFGLGADIGGSIRMPAFFNGVFGHKPTGGLVPGTGQFPMPENDALRYNCTGPIARRAEDLMPLVRILAGPDGIDSGVIARELGDPGSVDIAKVRVMDVRGNGFRRVSTELDAIQRDAASALEERGADVRRARIESLKRSLDMWAAMMSNAADTSFADHLYGAAPQKPTKELGRLALGRSDHTLPAVALTILERIAARMPERTRRFVEQGRALTDEIEDLLGDDGVMLFPSYTSVAPKHNVPLLLPFNWVYTAVFNIAQVPVTQVPLGLNADGLPLGVQVVGSRGRDHLTIAVANFLQETFGGWVPPWAVARRS